MENEQEAPINDQDRFEYEVTRQCWEEERQMLKNDPAYEEWLDKLESEHE